VHVAYSMPTARDEAQAILVLTGHDPLRAYQVVEQQMSVLVLRTQVMLSLSGIVITVTGFSGRAVAQTSALARGSIATGIFVVLAAAAAAIWGVLRLSWLTQTIVEDPVAMLTRQIEIRNDKSRFLSAALVLFVVGFSLYCFAIAQLLLAARPV
jgi:anaerobic C4-dicarboxylate transporter